MMMKKILADEYHAEKAFFTQVDSILLGELVRVIKSQGHIACAEMDKNKIYINFDEVKVHIVKNLPLTQRNRMTPEKQKILQEVLPSAWVRTLKGLNYHELAHLKFCLLSMQEVPSSHRRIMNVLQDGRDETLMTVKYPSISDYFRITNLTLIVRECGWGNETLKADNFVLLYAKKNFIPLKIVRGFEIGFREKYGDYATDETMNIVDQYIVSNDKKTQLRLIHELYELLKEFDPDPLGGSMEASNMASISRKDAEQMKEAKDESQKQIPEAQETVERVKEVYERLDDYEDDDGDDDGEDADDAGGSGQGDDDDDSDDEANGGSGSGEDTSDDDAEQNGGGGGADTADDDEDGQDGAGSGSDGDADGGDDGGSGSDDASGDDESDAGGDGHSDGEDGQDGDGGEGSGGGDYDEWTDNFDQMQDELRDDITRQLDDDIDRIQSDINDDMNTLKELRGKGKGSKVEEPTGHDFTPTSEVKRASSALKKYFKKINTGLEASFINGHKSGRLNPKKAMTSKTTGDMNIFKRWKPDQIGEAKIAVVILVDQSSSMISEQQLATQGAYLIAKAVESQPQNRVCVIGFSTGHKDNVRMMKGWDGRADWFSRASGSTPTHDGLLQAKSEIQALISHGYKKFIVFTLSDGEWDDTEASNKVIRELNTAGVITVEVNLSYDTRNASTHWVKIDDIQQFPDVMGDLLKKITVQIRRTLHRQS